MKIMHNNENNAFPWVDIRDDEDHDITLNGTLGA